MSEIKYKRIMLKVSGEALAGPAHRGLDFEVINSVCAAIKECVDMGVQVGLMVGAGNFWRGVKDGADKMQRSHADVGYSVPPRGLSLDRGQATVAELRCGCLRS